VSITDLDLLRRDVIAAFAEILRVGETQPGTILLRHDPASAEAVFLDSRERRRKVPLRRLTPDRAPATHGVRISGERDDSSSRETSVGPRRRRSVAITFTFLLLAELSIGRLKVGHQLRRGGICGRPGGSEWSA
jgi:hypothetical protein